MDTTADPRQAAARRAGKTLAEAAAGMENGHDPFAGIRFRVIRMGRDGAGSHAASAGCAIPDISAWMRLKRGPNE